MQNKNTGHNKLLAFLYILPVIIILGCLVYYPGIQGIKEGFFNKHLLKPVYKYVGLQQYKDLFFNHDYYGLIWQVTVKYFFTVVIGAMILGFIFALALDFQFKGKNLVLSLIFIPWILPETIVGTFWKWILNAESGIMNHMLYSMGFIEEYVNWLGNSDLALWMACFVMIWRTYPFVTIMLLAGLQGIPKQLYEAAKVDGATKIQVFLHVILPQIKYVLTITSIIISSWILKLMGIPYVLTGGGPYRTTEIYPLFVYKSAFKHFDFGQAAAAGNILFLILTVLGIIYVKKIVFKEG